MKKSIKALYWPHMDYGTSQVACGSRTHTTEWHFYQHGKSYVTTLMARMLGEKKSEGMFRYVEKDYSPCENYKRAIEVGKRLYRLMEYQNKQFVMYGRKNNDQ